jgi:hypothetical protein
LRRNVAGVQHSLAVTDERTYVRLSVITRYSEAAVARAKFVQKNGAEQKVEIGENVSVMLATAAFIPEVQS